MARDSELCSFSLTRSLVAFLYGHIYGSIQFERCYYRCAVGRRAAAGACLRTYAYESVISILRANSIVDRDTVVNMYDSESSLKEGAADLGFDLSTGGLPHKREFARIVTAWKTAKVMAETKLQTGRCCESTWCSSYFLTV